MPAAFARRCRRSLSLALVPALLALAATPLKAETHSSLQAVTSTGTSAWNGTFPFNIRGVLLCHPDEMLDSTPNCLPWINGANQYRIGGEWQVIFQAVDPGGRGGTTCRMGQNCGNQPWIHNSDLSYTNEAWIAEILRLNFDPSNLRQYRAGDLIEVTVRQSLFYSVKLHVVGHNRVPHPA